MLFYQALDALLRRDDGARGFSARAEGTDVEALGRELFAHCERALILTGFPVRGEDGLVRGETDGPPGAANIARALTLLGREAVVATDRVCFPQVKAAVELAAPGVAVRALAPQNENEAEALLGELRPTHVIALERPGKAADGHCRNARGQALDEWLADTDALFARAKAMGAVSVGVGDGGNELGMGNHSPVTESLKMDGLSIAAAQRSDWPLVAGVSNWWGWGIAALLSAESGRLLLPTPQEEESLLRAVVASGGVDGVTKRAALTVDGIPLARHLALLEEITSLTAGAVHQALPAVPALMRRRIRSGEWTRPTAGLCPGYAQCNLVALPEEYAGDFLRFTQRNPKPCPVLEVTRPGERLLREIAPGADVARDIPKYRLYQNGACTGEFTDAAALWRGDLVAFLIGCSFSFEAALLEAGVPVRHIEENRNVPMYNTNIPLEACGPFHGHWVVSMRPMTPGEAQLAAEVTAACPRVHGAPVHMGSPEAIGVKELSRPDYGEAVTIKPGEIPVFWACGVTPQAVAVEAKLPYVITHAPGHMLLSDVLNRDLMQR